MWENSFDSGPNLLTFRIWDPFPSRDIAIFWTRNFHLTRGFIALTLASNLATRAFSFLTCAFKLVTRKYELVNRKFELATSGLGFITWRLELVIRIFELLTRRVHLKSPLLGTEKQETPLENFGTKKIRELRNF